MAQVFLDPKKYWLKRWESIVEMINDGIEAFNQGGGDTYFDDGLYVEEDDSGWVIDELELESEGIVENDELLSEPHRLVRDAILSMVQFSDTLFHFFYEGYFGEPASDDFIVSRYDNVELRLALEALKQEKNLFDDPQTSADSVLHILLRQVQIDILRLQQAYFIHSEVGQQFVFLQDAQVFAGVLAEQTLRPNGDITFLDGQFANTTIMIFPNDTIKVRLLPYVDALLIGLPLSAYLNIVEEPMELSVDYLALSHETGHLVFQSGIIPHDIQVVFDGKRCARLGSHLHLKLPYLLQQHDIDPAKNEWAAEWLIEIFCDVYGALIDGPVFAVGFQQLMASDRMEEIHTSDGHHPIPVLRPLVQNLVMYRIADCIDEDGHSHFGWPKSAETVAESLVQLWGKVVKRNWPVWFKERGGNDYSDNDLGMFLANTTYEVDGVERTGQEILSVLDVVIELILETLKELSFRPEPGSWSQLEFSQQDTPEEIAERLFLQYLRDSQKLIEASQQYNESFSFATIAESNNSGQVIHMLRENKDAIESDKDLAKLLMTSGWEDEGPRGGGLGGWP